MFRLCLQMAMANKNQLYTIKNFINLNSSTENKRTVNISQFFKFPFQFKDRFSISNSLRQTIPQ